MTAKRRRQSELSGCELNLNGRSRTATAHEDGNDIGDVEVQRY